MSTIYFIVADHKIDALQKSRYLKFTAYAEVQGLFIYGRFDRQFDMIEPPVSKSYRLSNSGEMLLKQILEGSVASIFWSMVVLENNISDEEAYLHCLKKINKRQYETKVLAAISCLTQNKVYKITIN